ncbi:hypothetical protein ACTJI8_07705 [Microbacterium sp. 22303]|uniref:hypothetical protein n=1 Tax=Microbacterium sp. 22303 TaxID=3453905 RepID=UPI003F868C52
MTEPTDQPPAGPRAMPAGATRREARLRRESLTSAEFEVPQLAPSLAPPRVQPLPQPLVPTTAGAAPTRSPRREARLRQAGSVPAAEPVDPAPTTGSAPRRRRAIVWLGIAAALVLIAGLGFGLWLVRAPESTAADSPRVAAPVDPIAERGFEGAGSPSASAPQRTPSPTPTPPTAVPPVETVVAPTPVDSGQHDETADGGSAPPSSAPAPGSPAPANPAPANPAPAPAAPAPLAFTGLTENTTLGLLGIRILASDTLSLAGQPGATATVSYGSARAGSVTFDGAGRATLTVNGSLVDLGDPLITVAYSDGTAGAVLRARRSAI